MRCAGMALTVGFALGTLGALRLGYAAAGLLLAFGLAAWHGRGPVAALAPVRRADRRGRRR